MKKRNNWPLVGLFCVLTLVGCDKLFPKSSEKPAPAPVASVPTPESKPVPASSPAPTGEFPPNALVRVGNWSLTAVEFKERLEAVKEFIPDFNPSDPEAKRFVLDEIIKQQLLVDDAEKKGLGKNTDVVQAVEEFRRTLLVRELATQLTKDIQVTEAEAEEYYNQNKNEFAAPGEWHVREIVLNTEEEAKKLLVEILQGKDFAQLAQEHSIAPSAVKQGDLGWVTEFEFPEMENAVKLLNAGGVSSVFKGPSGYYIVKLEEKKGGELKAFSELKEEIISGLTMLKQQQAILGYLDQLRQNAKVEINEKLLEE